MRSAPALLGLLLLAACGSMHDSNELFDLAEPAVPVGPPRIGCVAHPKVIAWERRLRRQEWRQETRDGMARGRVYLPRLRKIVSDAGLPPSLALLPLIESSFRADARGRLDELGLWQLRRDTARRFGLHVDERRDDRLQPDRATVAAVHYLRFLHGRYHDWPLALAAYNAGERRVDRLLARQPDADFWQIAAAGGLPRTSREYVPRFLAMVRMIEGPQHCIDRRHAA